MAQRAHRLIQVHTADLKEWGSGLNSNRFDVIMPVASEGNGEAAPRMTAGEIEGTMNTEGEETFDLKRERETTIPAPTGQVRVKIKWKKGRFRVHVLEGGKVRHLKNQLTLPPAEK